jgi:hypothetical protein
MGTFNMNLNNLQLLGLIMVVFAFGAQVLIPGAVVYYSTASVGVAFIPTGTTPNNPQYLPAGWVAPAQMMIQGISQAEILNASVQISKWSGSVWNLVGTYIMSYNGMLQGTPFMEYQYLFTTSTTPATLYAYSYSLSTTDAGSFTGIGYYQTATLSGYFSINGQQVTNTSFLKVSSPTLSLTYTVTASGITPQNGPLVVTVKIFNGTQTATQLSSVTLTADMANYADMNMTGSYTLPGQGTYTLQGFVAYAGTNYEQMSILGSWGDLTNGINSMSFSDYYLIVGIFGVLFIIIGARKKKAT